MIRSKTKTLAHGVLASALLLASGSGFAQSGFSEDITLRYAFFAPPQTFPAVQMQEWADRLHARTDGTVSVDLFPGGTLLTAANMYDGVTSGVADIGLSATSYEPGRFPLINVAGRLTGQDVNSEEASRMVFELIEQYGDQMPGLEGFKVITAFTSEPAYIQTIDPVRQAEDMAGKDIRISGGNSQSLNVLGANALGMSQAEAGEALQTGVIDGYAASREVLMDMGFAETVKHVTDYPLTNTIFVAAMSERAWNKLPPEVQSVIDELAPEMAGFTGRYLDDHIDEALTWAQAEEGVEIISLADDEQARWENLLAPINQDILKEVEDRGLPAREFARSMQEILADIRAE